MAASKRSLSLRITLWVVLYMLVLSVAVIALGNSINEHAERMVWKSMLHSEIDHFDRRRIDDPSYRWRDIEGASLFGWGSGRPMPPELARFKPGLHDDVRFEGRDHVLLVRMVDGQRQALMMDIGEFERDEFRLSAAMLAGVVLVLVLLGAGMGWTLRRLVRPLADMAGDIGRLRPDHAGQRVAPAANASSEMVVIANALNDYLARNERYVDREHQFIATSSHELRTPVAVIAGAAELALDGGSVPDAVRHQLERILRTARGVEQLIALLLVLARDPARLSAISETFRLDAMLPELVEDHRHLCAGKDLELAIAPSPPCTLHAPAGIVRAAIGNLLRNAIENSDRGTITLALGDRGVVSIEDPGHGMAPEEIGALYARMAREGDAGAARSGGGIGLELIARLCEHLGWGLRIEPRPPQGTRVVLELGAALAAA
ncbi:HAMP domain-containing histidine kinase [Pseudoluteimonas lycopersici]|uniref:histidine kinase n=1 Tax=Pseudoluteimonas lycopersici TaxID=1324796 RepID=A0A516V1Z6_9GAMM|nr:HAMP domain-containing sensor histidine kinase [Lysobacter lycopersici]QDQ72530.1 HAMP domain-containing histidine kinase [Lysobacter lycopersici]